jgi:hypothetical protein
MNISGFEICLVAWENGPSSLKSTMIFQPKTNNHHKMVAKSIYAYPHHVGIEPNMASKICNSKKIISSIVLVVALVMAK